MNGHVRILRFDPERDRAPHWEEYVFPFEPGMTVLDSVLYVQRELDGTLAFGHNCRNSHCGLCAARVDGRPVLMCREPARTFMRLEPLRHIPVIRDLLLDLNAHTESEAALRTFLERRSAPGQEPETVDMQAFAAFRVASRCVRCLICTSVCPVYAAQPHGFVGPALLVRLARHAFDPRDQGSRALTAYLEGVLSCTQCGACSRVCPHDLDPAGVIAGLQRLAGNGRITR